MRLGLLLTLAVLLALPAPALADPFGELPPRVLGDIGWCLRATGVPGELVRGIPNGARFMQADGAGTADAEDVITDTPTPNCPSVAVQPNGAGVLLVGVDKHGVEAGVMTSVREPGGSWSPLTRIPGE